MGYLRELQDRPFLSYKEKLTHNVPYCMQSPFYDIKNRLLSNPSKKVINEINQQERLLYYFEKFNHLQTRIKISAEWIDYLCRNREILKDWVRYNLIGYLQDRNPSVPGIADKILPPYKRKLEYAKEYWKTMISVDPSLCDIYGNNNLTETAISIDHFIPWQFVAHDELWNLSPTTKSINSQKSNYLPEWDMYFITLSDMEYTAYMLQNTSEVAQQAFQRCATYHLNNPEIRNQLYEKGLEKPEFQNRLSNVVRPIYDSAKNCGFREWVLNND